MDSLYIATSSLNFNSILTTESISPESFYKKRNFGYKRFNKVVPNPFSNSLLAYDKLPLFIIDDKEYDDYPLVIKISKDLISDECISKVFEKNDLKIYQINKTLFLHPNSVEFLFFSEKDKNTCLIKVEPSIETKLLPVYKSKIRLFEKDIDTFKWDKSLISRFLDLSDNEVLKQIELDSKINKLKGFYYTYYLGVILSSSIRQKSLKEEFISIMKSIVEFRNVNKTLSINERIIDELKNFKIKIKESEGDKNISNEVLLETFYFEDSGIKEQQKLIEFLKQSNLGKGKINFYSQLEQSFENLDVDDKMTLLIDNLIEYINKSNSGELLSKKSTRIIKYISSLKQKEAKIVDPLFVVENINFVGNKVTQLSDDFYKKRGIELYRNIINEIIDYPIYDVQSFLEQKVSLALKIGEVLKESLEESEDWGNSRYRTYLNSLLDNIENFQPFDVKSHPSLILQSIAIFILKGDSPEKLIDSLKQNGISDYRIALGLWGAIFGFSALPKTLTNVLFEKDNIYRTRIFYKSTQNKLYNSNSDNIIEIESIVKKVKSKIEEPIVEKKDFQEVNNNVQNSNDNPKCPKCGAEMIYRENGNFYGCTNYIKTGCKGSRDYPYLQDSKKNEKADTNSISKYIIECVEQNGHSKISDINKWVKRRIPTFTYNVEVTKNHIKENLKDELEFAKLENSSAKAVRLRDKRMFD